jgi:hypothetical protein
MLLLGNWTARPPGVQNCPVDSGPRLSSGSSHRLPRSERALGHLPAAAVFSWRAAGSRRRPRPGENRWWAPDVGAMQIPSTAAWAPGSRATRPAPVPRRHAVRRGNGPLRPSWRVGGRCVAPRGGVGPAAALSAWNRRVRRRSGSVHGRSHTQIDPGQKTGLHRRAEKGIHQCLAGHGTAMRNFGNPVERWGVRQAAFWAERAGVMLGDVSSRPYPAAPSVGGVSASRTDSFPPGAAHTAGNLPAEPRLRRNP